MILKKVTTTSASFLTSEMDTALPLDFGIQSWTYNGN